VNREQTSRLIKNKNDFNFIFSSSIGNGLSLNPTRTLRYRHDFGKIKKRLLISLFFNHPKFSG
jgi:hypothetical protein